MAQRSKKTGNLARDCLSVCDFLQEPTFAGKGDTVDRLAESDFSSRNYAVNEVLDDGWPGPGS